ncbi:MAG: tRNA (N(6)-L-threonylcarbamoyladenosine(37)-C(2))-methylthiotransferase MtaB [Alphaproteobacteria bacterium]|nr:tRNA (N(6)-L-threonylcarbamoyladenosine(37)-C(2))-methylthiotransferase MtaB [Alphaproteobacteria bacterium]
MRRQEAVTKPEIITFGCRLNSFESEIIRSQAAEAGLEDVVVVHTCAVTAEAERQARQAIRRAKRERPDARIVVTGCSAQISPDIYAGMDEVDQVLGNREKLDPDIWKGLSSQVLEGPRVVVGDVDAIRETAGHLIDGLDGRSRAFVQVQNGCDHRCTFCIIPYGRGPSRSVPVGEAVAQTRRLVEHGHKEVVLTGVDLTSYGRDLPGQPSLGQLARRLLKLVPELPRLRLSSIDPAEVDPDLFELIAGEPRLMPHLHLSVQAGDTLTLKRMKRRHTRDDVITLSRICKGLRPEIAFGADLIAGFPTETEAMFENTLDLVEEADLTFLHVFPYSARKGTPAAKMPQVQKAIARERAARLRAAGDRALARFLEREKTRRATLLVERDQGGHTETFAPFRFGDPANAPAPGSLAPVVAERIEGGMLVGRLAA